MNKQVEKFAKTVDDAINEALDELGVSLDEALIEVLDEGEPGGLLGFGRRPAHVRVSVDLEDESEMPAFVESEMPAFTEEELEMAPEEAGDADIDEGDQAELPDAPDAADVLDEAVENVKQPRPTDGGRGTFTEEEKDRMEDRAVEFVASILQNLDIHGRISSYYADDGCLRIDVSGENLGNAIGRRGETLYAIQYLTTLAINRDHDRYQRVYVDIDYYRDRHIRELRSRARRSAERVLKSGRRYVLPPMPAADRRQVHLALADFQGIVTYSEGDEPRRSVVIDRDTNY